MKKYDIFISYRRSSFEVANMIALKLMMQGYSVFIDVESLHGGRFNDQLYNAIDRCKDFLLILQPNTLDKCYDEDDWVRQEVCRAISSKKNIVPIMLNDFSWPAEMPDVIKGLCEYQALTVSSANSFDSDMTRLQRYFLISKKHPLLRKVLNICVMLFIPFVLYVAYYFLRLHQNTYAPSKKYLIEFSDTTLYSDKGRFHSLSAELRDSLILYFIGAKSGDVVCQYKLGKLCYQSNICRDFASDAVYWLSTAVDAGNAEAANVLGCCYYHGRGVTKSPYIALQLFLLSGDGGCADGMNNAGKCYSEGSGTFLPKFPNHRRARKLYEKASVMSEGTAALYNLGVYYVVGLGGKKDVGRGIRTLEIAANRNSSSAKLRLGDIYCEQKDTLQAIKWYKIALESGDLNVKSVAQDELHKLQSKYYLE